LSAWALEGKSEYKEQLKSLEHRHLEAVRELISIQRQSAVIANVKFTINELEDVLHGVYLVKKEHPERLII